jgi:hypothetical protein
MPPQDPYAAFGPPVKAPVTAKAPVTPPATAKVDQYAAFGPPVKPGDPTQVAQDPDFLKASPADQVKYLSSQDPDFAKASPADQIGYLSHLTGKPAKAFANTTPATPTPQHTVSQVLTQPTDKTDREYLGYTGPAGVAGATIHGLNNVAKSTTDAARSMWDMITKPAQTTTEKGASLLGGPIGLIAARTISPLVGVAKQVPEIPSAVRDINASPDPLGHYANAAEDTAAQSAGQALVGAGTEGLGRIIHAANAAAEPGGLLSRSPLHDIVSDTYSKTGDHLAASLRSNSGIDVPAEAKIAAPAIEEGLNDRGFSTRDFKGRNGPQVLQSGIDNALDIQEARAKSYIDPIRGERVDPEVLARNPELAARFAPEKINGLTYGDLDAERVKLNQELRRGNFYSKVPSAQYAAADPMADAHAAASQARNLVYDKTYDTTGADLRPLKQTESALIKLGDLAETTKNTLSAKGAQHAVTPLYKKVGGTIQGALSAKANPVNAFSIPEKPGLFNPLNEFNNNMQKAFPTLDSTVRASRTAPPFPRFNLTLTPSGTMPPPLQRVLNLSGGSTPP